MEVIRILKNDEYIPAKYRDHALSGSYKGYRECHIRSNWLLIYESTEIEVIMVATGTHNDLFK
jgi:mRNA interferase YafQ